MRSPLLALLAALVALWTLAISAASAGAAIRCTPESLNRSAILPGTRLAVSPLPDSYDASTQSQISLLDVSPSALTGVSVTGSQSGPHVGHLAAYSQGDGASFLPATPFRPGETVTVRGRIQVGAASAVFAYHFVIAQSDAMLYAAAAGGPADPKQMQHFHSRPDLIPPAVAVSARSPQSSPGYIFSSPYAGAGPSGPMIFDEAGNLVWFHPLPHGTEGTNLQVQTLAGARVLTWWQGRITAQGFGEGEEIIADATYRQTGRVLPGNGYRADLHDFHISPQGTAVMTIFHPILCDLSPLGGPSDGAVTDSIFQEVDLATGLVRREWHSVDHVDLGDSYNPASGGSIGWPFDFMHINSVEQLPGNRTLISARNTWALYSLDTLTGQVLTRIGGRRSQVKILPGAGTAFQHDATVLPSGFISVFDNGATPTIHPQSRGVIVSINPKTRTDTELAQFEHPRPLSSGSQGNIQLLENGDFFLGWGSQPYFSEFSSAGRLLFDAHMHGSYQSYRSYRFPWSGSPSEPPAIAAVPSSASSPVTVFASWNGDTRTTSWQVLAGPSPEQLTSVASAPRSGFETAIATPGAAPYVAVQALGASGEVLATSRTIAG